MFNKQKLIAGFSALGVVIAVALGVLLVNQFAGGQTACVAPPTGLVSWWPGDGNGNDIVGANSVSLLNGAIFGAGKVGQSFNVGGAHGFAQSVTDVPITGDADLSIDAWVNFNDITSGFRAVAALGQTSSLGGMALFQGAAGAGSVSVEFYGNNACRTAPGVVTAGTWYHIAATKTPGPISTGTVTLYIDGVAQALTCNSAGTPNIIAGPAFLGNDSANELGNDMFLDEVEIFNRALLQSEIQSIFNAGSAGKCTAPPPPPVCIAPPSGLVSWWQGENNANDIFGSNSGTLQGDVTFAAGKVALAFSFNGVGEVRVPDVPDLNPQVFTLDAWARPTNPDGGVDIIVNKEINNSSLFNIQYEFGRRGSTPGGTIPAGNLAFFIGGISGFPDEYFGWVNGGGALPLNTWSHVALTFNGNTANAYINGVLTRTITGLSGTIPTTTGLLKIGARSDSTNANNPTERWNGLIDEVELFNRALSASEIQSIFNAGSAGKCQVPLDITPPTVTASASDLDLDGYLDRRDVTLQADDAAQSGVKDVTYSLDGAPVVTTSGSIVTVSIPDGTHTLSFYATDNARNSSLAQTETYKVLDNCPRDANPDQLDSDADGLGDVCDGTNGANALGTDFNAVSTISGTDGSYSLLLSLGGVSASGSSGDTPPKTTLTLGKPIIRDSTSFFSSFGKSHPLEKVRMKSGFRMEDPSPTKGKIDLDIQLIKPTDYPTLHLEQDGAPLPLIFAGPSAGTGYTSQRINVNLAHAAIFFNHLSDFRAFSCEDTDSDNFCDDYDINGDGDRVDVIGGIGESDACPTVAGAYQGCPFGDKTIVTLHIVDQQKSGVCGTLPDGKPRGECKKPLANILVEVFDRENPDFVRLYGSRPPKQNLNVIFESGVGQVGQCATETDGSCIAGEDHPGKFLVIARYVDGSNTVYTGKLKNFKVKPSLEEEDDSDTDNNTTPPNLIQKQLRILKIINKDGTVKYSAGKMTVIAGSELDIIHPDYTIWQGTSQLYPFVMSSADAWTTDVCLQVPAGYKISAILDQDGNALPAADCAQSFVSGETKVLLFTATETGSPEPDFNLSLKTDHKGKKSQKNLTINGIRKATKDQNDQDLRAKVRELKLKGQR